MSSRSPSVSSETSRESTSSSEISSELNFPSISAEANDSQLAIVAYLYSHLVPKILTPKHIAAIQIYNYPNNPSSSPTFISCAAVTFETIRLIEKASAYAKYCNNLTNEQRGERGYLEHFRMFERETDMVITLAEFRECIKNYVFIERMNHDGELAQRQILLDGWEAYMLVPEQVKRGLGLPIH